MMTVTLALPHSVDSLNDVIDVDDFLDDLPSSAAFTCYFSTLSRNSPTLTEIRDRILNDYSMGKSTFTVLLSFNTSAEKEEFLQSPANSDIGATTVTRTLCEVSIGCNDVEEFKRVMEASSVFRFTPSLDVPLVLCANFEVFWDILRENANKPTSKIPIVFPDLQIGLEYEQLLDNTATVNMVDDMGGHGLLMETIISSVAPMAKLVRQAPSKWSEYSALPLVAKCDESSVINMSFVAQHNALELDMEVSKKSGQGCTVVVAANRDMHRPAGNPNAITVGKIGETYNRSADIYAPGEFLGATGVSIATAIVSGVCAVIQAILGSVYTLTLTKKIVISSSSLSDGLPVLDAQAAIALAAKVKEEALSNRPYEDIVGIGYVS